jgi:hypothetical protein
MAHCFTFQIFVWTRIRQRRNGEETPLLALRFTSNSGTIGSTRDVS